MDRTEIDARVSRMNNARIRPMAPGTKIAFATGDPDFLKDDAGGRRFFLMQDGGTDHFVSPRPAPDIRNDETATRCTEIADQVVPEYRREHSGGRYYSCTGHTAKRWQAAWDGACVALGRDPKEYLG